jgi:RNA polymerase sigma factor (sigma-70 family)
MNQYHDHTDADLVELLQSGDTKAFEAIYKRYAPALYRFAHQNIPVKEECREVLQDIFEYLWTKRSSLQILNLKPYLYNMVRYRVIRYFRRTSNEQKYAQHYFLFEAALTSLPEEEWSSEKIRLHMLNNLDGLGERAKIAFRLRLLENLSNSEIAERMQISKLTVESYIVKVFNHFRAIGDFRKADE